uniref:Oligopeptide transporter n=1 Tax=Odontella aurita TaxID=265563 RepID=A0A6U6KYX8_9STRA|mmetsp:Transcript_63165/g.186672  ORF Transcript_63165/g.186672 Transcript_63165/m.186672 type:complete len:661 (+) Transcript_63165:400-2382(+)
MTNAAGERTALMEGVETRQQTAGLDLIPLSEGQDGASEAVLSDGMRKPVEFEDGHEDEEKDKDAPQLTVRAVVVGLIIGTVLCFTNMHFGLQTGWVTMGSIQAAVVGFAVFKLCLPENCGGGTRGVPFGPLENVVLQTVSVATATMPLAGGFVGIIPALGMLDPPVRLTGRELLAWCAALTYFGIFFAVPLRRQTILVEELPFPSGTATAKLIEVLHGKGDGSREELAARWRSLGYSFAASFALSLVCFFVPAFENWHVGSWVGMPFLTSWQWTLRPSLSYVGQGMIMGLRPALSMLGGAVVGWAVLGPLARGLGWAPGEITNWEDGALGWLLWVSIGLMLAEALTSFVIAACFPASGKEKCKAPLKEYNYDHDEGEVEVAPPSQLVPTPWWAGGLASAVVLVMAVFAPLFGIQTWQTFLAVALSCLVAILAVRALGQTDLNPVSGVGKLSQIVFAFVAPGHVVTNLAAGALAEAGAMQAGDLMQDLKTGHLLGASPRAQFFSQLIGSTASIFVTVAAFSMYESTYGIPSTDFPAPVAHIWKDMALLMKDGPGALPRSAVCFAALFAVIGVSLPILEMTLGERRRHWVPSGIAFGIGMYITPDWTIPRVIGAVVESWWHSRNPSGHSLHYLMVASGFVLGDGVMSILALLLKAMQVPTFG